MHRALAAWLTERPWRAAFASALCGALSFAPLLPLLPFVVLAGAIPVLVLLRYQLGLASAIALSGAVAGSWVAFRGGEDAVPAVMIAAAISFGPVLLAVSLKRSGSLNLCFQIAVLASAAIVAGAHLVLEDPAAFWRPLVAQMFEQAGQAGAYSEAQAAQLERIWVGTMWGALAAGALAVWMSAILLGRWWDSLLHSPGAFGVEYRRLKLGVVLGSLVTVSIVAALLSDSLLVASFAWIAVPALTFQGLAAAHRSKARGSLSQGWLAAIYVVLIMPLSTWIAVIVLAIWGFVDNWLRPQVRHA